jgi:hypothetical protein
MDFRYGSALVYMQSILDTGSIGWTSDGVRLDAVGGEDYTRASVVSDGSGGGIAVWHLDGHSGHGYDYDIAAHGVNSGGSLKWSGVAIDVATSGQQSYPAIVSDDAGGIIVTWYDDHSGDDRSYVQRVDSSGVLQWGVNGIQVCNVTTSDQLFPVITKDGSGGAVVAWTDRRNDATTSRDIYAQKIDSNGNYSWDDAGIAISTAAYVQTESALITDSSGNTFIVWHDDRDNDDDLYCQLISDEGTLLVSNQEYVNTPTTYSFTNVQLEMTFTSLTGAGNVNVNEIAEHPEGFDSSHSAGVFWQIDEDSSITTFNTSITFTYTGYLGSLSEPDLMIYRNDGSGWAQWVDFSLNMASDEITANNVTGFSEWAIVDDDSPLPITLSSFFATFSNGSSILQWTTQSENNNMGWNVYRAESDEMSQSLQINSEMIEGAGTTFEPTNYTFLDEYEVFPEITYFYWLESIDLNGETQVYGPVSVDIPNNDEDQQIPDLPSFYGLHQNFPNPFNPTTHIAFKLLEDSIGKLEIFNVKGQYITTLFEGNIAADEVNIFEWDGKDAKGTNVSSGIYLYKLISGNNSQIKKMLMLK